MSTMPDSAVEPIICRLLRGLFSRGADRQEAPRRGVCQVDQWINRSAHLRIIVEILAMEESRYWADETMRLGVSWAMRRARVATGSIVHAADI